jgi:putative N-acetylmannosamine-6-phosphate epimerase
MAKGKTFHINVPTDVTGYNKLINDINAQNTKLGNKSQLKDETAEIKQGVKDMTQVVSLDTQIITMDKTLKKFRQQRNKLMNTTLQNERGWRTTLEGKNLKDIQGMSDYGYDIGTTPRTITKPAKPATTAK